MSNWVEFPGGASRALDADEKVLFLRPLRRCLLLLALILLAAQAATALLSARVLEADLLPQLHRRAELLGETVAERISYAVSLGIPLPNLVGMEPYLAGVLEANAEVSYLAVTDLHGQALFWAGPGLPSVEGETPHLTEIGEILWDARAEDTPLTRMHGDHYDTRVVVTDGDGPIGHLHIGRPASVRDSIDLIWAPSLPVMFVVVFLLTAELLTVALSGSYAVAWSWLRTVMARIAAGDFRHRPVLPQRTVLGRIANATGKIVTDINDRFEQLTDEAEAIKAGQLDRSVPARIDETLGAVERRYRFVPPGEETPVRPLGVSRLRLPLIFLFTAVFLPLPFLVDAALRLRVWSEWIDPETLAAQPLALLFGTAAGLLILMRSTGFLGFLWNSPRSMLALAGFLIAVAPGLAWLSGINLGLTVWAAVCGLALGFCVQATERYADLAQGGTPTSRGSAALVVAGAVALAGAAPLGGLLVALGVAPMLWVASGILGLVGMGLAIKLVAGRRSLQTMYSVAAALSDEGETSRLGQSSGTGRSLLIAAFSVYPLAGIVGGYVFYLLPLQVDVLGLSAQVGGRATMAFGLAAVLAAAVVAHVRPGRRLALLGLGLVGVLAGGLVMAASGVLGPAGTIPGVSMLGIPAAWWLAGLLAVLAVSLALAARLMVAAQGRGYGEGDEAAVRLDPAAAAVAAPAALSGLAAGPFSLGLAFAFWGLPMAMLVCGGFAVGLSVVLLLVGLTDSSRSGSERGGR